MIWWLTGTLHESAIGLGARRWVRSTFSDRLMLLLPYASILWSLIGMIAISHWEVTPAMLYISAVPFAFWILDWLIERATVSSTLASLLRRENAVLATRAEYIGGHPQLPHGRFVYLLLRGTKQDPKLSIVLPSQSEYKAVNPDEFFDIPLLDLNKTDERSETATSLTGTLLASLSERSGKMFADESVTLAVRYHGEGGRDHIVEFSSFYHGGGEIRNWRNYLVCAQNEGDTGVAPRAPWMSLPSASNITNFEEVKASHGNNGSRNGHSHAGTGSAFERR